MKINKLFHWLYACLMFLPIMVFLPSIFYYGFNKEAQVPQVVDVEYQYKYQSNEVNSFADLKVNNLYKLDYFYINNNALGDFEFICKVYQASYVGFDDKYSEYAYLESIDLQSCIVELAVGNFETDSHYVYLYIYLSEDDYDNDYSFELTLDDTVEIENLVVSFSSTEYLEAFNDYYNSNQALYDLSFLEYTDYNIIQSVDVIEDDTPSISTVVSRAWNDTWQNPLFSWSYNSFLTEPFKYVTGLFGVPNDSTLNYTFSYWLSISICWLVFDLVMYVPMLVHRWLDKASLS